MLFRELLLIPFVIIAYDEAFGLQTIDSPGDNSQNPAASGSITSAVGFSNEPQLVSGGIVEIPPLLLKKGIEGSVSVKVDIKKDGTIERCSIVKSKGPLLDSLVLASVPRFVYSPAIEKGQAVSATLMLEIVFNLDSMVARSGLVSLCGC